MTDDRKIYIYPTPENIEKIQYIDATETCFDFKQEKVKCPKNEKDISIIPSQA